MIGGIYTSTIIDLNDYKNSKNGNDGITCAKLTKEERMEAKRDLLYDDANYILEMFSDQYENKYIKALKSIPKNVLKEMEELLENPDEDEF